jgi:hypothetical protein
MKNCKALEYIKDWQNSLKTVISFIAHNDSGITEQEVENNILQVLSEFKRPIKLYRHDWKEINRIRIEVVHNTKDVVIKLKWAKTKHQNPIDAFDSYHKDAVLSYTSSRIKNNN